jgi:hypothetical protein
MEPEDLEAVRALLPTVDGWADQVAALGLPLTLCHNDLHGNNVFDRGGELRFFDFADALVMEPLAALLIPINALRTGSRPRRTTRGCGGSPTPASRSGPTTRRPPSCGPRCRPRSSWPGWPGPSRGSGAPRR